jgi:heme exporter protein D
MTPLGPHADFIVAAYAVALVVIVALIVWVLVDYQSQQRLLGDLEQRGVERRSRRSAHK